MHVKYLLHIARDGKIDIVQKQHLKLGQIIKIKLSNHFIALAKKKKVDILVKEKIAIEY